MEIPYEVTPRRDTGLYNSKLAVWLFLASEVMLFGGLFSGYVFLRLGIQDGVDNPWPWGLNVHKGYVWLGFINTLVLIGSSVAVVFAWVALKERNWRRFQVLMYGVVACAVAFMCIKSVEYHSKLTQHHGIKLLDNSVMEGKIVDGTDKIRFEADKVSFSLQGALPIFLREMAEDEFPELTLEGEDAEIFTSKGEFSKWFYRSRRETASALATERKRYRSELAEGIKNPSPVSVSTSATVTASKPFKVNGNPRTVIAHSDSAMNYRDGSKVEGSLTSDDVVFEIHEVDMQLVMPTKQRDSIIWEVIGDENAKKEFFTKQAKYYETMRAYYAPRGETIPEKMLRGHKLNLHYVHVGGDHGHDDDHSGESHDDKEHHGEEVHTSESKPSASKLEKDTGHHGTITVPRDKIKFMGNHGPRYGNYYAIYFTMTALHGLHVIGGALVLLYFVVFGKKMFLKNPEHLANRVEVGGLFWHFVDLIWIFLFPIMYLL
ncbi:MAG: cytochrome c oxidase subunit 3 [Verrucomicrobiales bacterium]|nr:cytochrome c oxidase subunit 3 [Verrucomicrobiales bacterium]